MMAELEGCQSGRMDRTANPVASNSPSEGSNPSPSVKRTHCKRGHPLWGANLYVYPGGRRSCRACRQLVSRGVCETCGQLAGIESKYRGGRRCIGCVQAARAVRQAEIDAARDQKLRDADRIEPSELKELTKAYRKLALPSDAKLTDKQKAIVRLLKVAPEPLSARALSAVFARLPRRWIGYERSGLRASLRILEHRGIVCRVEVDRVFNADPKCLWFVSVHAASDEPLRLDDALQERELALLIADQEREAARGAWAEVDFRTRSMDAPLGESGSWHDILEDMG